MFMAYAHTHTHTQQHNTTQATQGSVTKSKKLNFLLWHKDTHHRNKSIRHSKNRKKSTKTSNSTRHFMHDIIPHT